MIAGEVNYLAALLVGLLGGVHCVGMCGGIVATLGIGLPAQRTWPLLLAYNGGRLFSYTLAGAVAGGFGALLAGSVAGAWGQWLLALLAALLMIALGLYLGGWWFGLLRLERLGGRWWRYLEPTARRLLPVRGVAGASALGALWGWLPCGLVYSVLIWSLSSGGALNGALLMAAFGLGTLPNLLAMGLLARQLGQRLQQPIWRRSAGVLVLLLGITALLPLLWPFR